MAPEGQPKKKTETDALLEKVYCNISACHIKMKNWDRALQSANKALHYDENNFKAMFRKGKSQGELGYFEKAEKTLEDLKKKNPVDAAIINAELTQLREKDKQREKRQNEKLKGFLSRDKSILTPDVPVATTSARPATPPASAKLEEVEEDDSD